MADELGEQMAAKEVVKQLEESPKVLINGEEFTACSDHDLAASSNSEEEDHKSSFRSPSPADSHSENETNNSPGEFHPPSDEVKEKIVKQVEFYLSDENLARDAFLLKHVRRNKEGYVNLKLITSFKKVKSLTKDYRVVGEALKDSTVLTLNAENTKIRRNEPLRTELMERNPGRTVIATNIDNPTFEHVSEMFSKCGEVVLIRIIRPGKDIPVDLRDFKSKFPELEKETFAVIEFETMAAAARACSELSNKDGGMRVVELGRGARKKDKKSKNKDVDTDSVPESDEEHEEKKKRKRNRGKKNKNRLAELAAAQSDDSHTSSCSSDTDSSSHNSFSSCGRRRYRSSPGLGGTPSSSGNHREPAGINGMWRSPQSSPEPARKSFNTSPAKEGSNSAPNSPWSQRRKTTSPKPNGHSPLANSGPVKHRMVQLEGVQRLPRGPDGTKGFHGGFGRGHSLIAVA